MKRIFKVLGSLLIVVLTAGLVKTGNAADVCQNVTLQTLKNQLPFQFPKEAKIISKRPEKGLCEVILNVRGRNFPMYVGKDFIILGQMFSEKKFVTGNILRQLAQKTKRVHEEAFRKLIPQVDKLVVMKYNPVSHPKHVIYMFTDPVCPFCHQAEGEIKAIAEKYKAGLRIVFFPVHRPSGEKKAIEAVCRHLTLDEYLKDEWRHEDEKTVTKYQCKKGKKLIQESESLGSQLGLRGVPTFILENGQRVVGANMPKLEKLLSK